MHYLIAQPLGHPTAHWCSSAHNCQPTKNISKKKNSGPLETSVFMTSVCHTPPILIDVTFWSFSLSSPFGEILHTRAPKWLEIARNTPPPQSQVIWVLYTRVESTRCKSLKVAQGCMHQLKELGQSTVNLWKSHVTSAWRSIRDPWNSYLKKNKLMFDC